ncbi:MAG: hypothetical protein C0468_03055 [Planctomyces sp.]|nr:hypothetical protein [Planctomyces sp.]
MHQALILSFFGPEVAAAWASRGPRGLLGIGPGAAAPAQVAAAAQFRLAVVRAHELASSPMGLEMARLIEEAALDVAHGHELTPGPRGGLTTGGAAPQAPEPTSLVRDLLDADARTSGALGVAALVAVIGGLAVAGLLAVVVLLPRPGGGAAPSGERQGASAGAGPGPAIAAAPAGAASAPADAPGAPAEPGFDPRVVVTPRDPEQAMLSLRLAAQVAPAEPAAALERLAASARLIASEWPGMRPGDVLDAALSAIETARALPPGVPELGVRWASAVLGGPDAPGQAWADPVGRAWAVAALVRASREREIPGPIRAAAEERLESLARPIRAFRRQSFGDALALAVRFAAQGLAVDGPDAASAEARAARWLAGARGAAAVLQQGRAADAQAVIADGLDELLRSLASGPLSAAQDSALRVLAGAAAWSTGDPALARLPGWLQDPKIDAPALAVVTRAASVAVDKSGAAAQLVLSGGADAAARQALALRYARLAGVVLSEDRSVSDQFARALRLADSAASGADASPASVARAAYLARLNSAMFMSERGLTGEGLALLASARPPAIPQRRALGPVPEELTPRAGADSPRDEWALRYLTGDRTPLVRAARIRERQAQRAPLTQLEADVLVESALGSSGDVADAARAYLRGASGQATVPAALLKVLHRAPRSVGVSELAALVAPALLPDPASPRWALEARRGLVESLLDAIAQGTDAPTIDAAVGELLGAYADSADRADLLAAGAQAQPAVRLIEAASALSERTIEWLEAAGRVREAVDVEQRRLARRSVAFGLTQRFAAEQATVLEALALWIEARSPDRGPPAAQVASAARDRLDRATHIAQQVLVAERAIADLWLVRWGQPRDAGDAADTAQPAAPPPERASLPPRPQPADAPAPTIEAERAEVRSAELLLPGIGQRLAGLRPDRPEGYLLLAEELAAEASDGPSLSLARRLYALAAVLDAPPAGSGRWAPSALIGLAGGITDDHDRRWLFGLARAISAEIDRSGRARRAEPEPIPDRVAVEVAAALDAARWGDGRRAELLLAKPSVSQALRRLEPGLEAAGSFGATARVTALARQWATPCPVCRGRRTIARAAQGGGPAGPRICPHCAGVLGPPINPTDLIAELRLESSILSGSHRAWSAQWLADGGRTLDEPHIRLLPRRHRADLTRSVFVGGAWVAPDAPADPPAPPAPAVEPDGVVNAP